MTLTRIVDWSHLLASEVLAPGDLAIDLTAGKGRDTAMLADAVGPHGTVVAFDIQLQALTESRQGLVEKGLQVTNHPVERVLQEAGGVFLVHACHSRLTDVIQRPARIIMANLGYLPGGDQTVTTLRETTVTALQKALSLLSSRGRLLVTVYPGHPGGAVEGEAVRQLLSGLDSADWQVLQVKVVNHADAPYLLAAEKKH